MKLTKLTPDEQRVLIPDEEARRSFLRRHDIATLPPDEQEARWQAHLVEQDEYREFLSRYDCFRVTFGDPS